MPPSQCGPAYVEVRLTDGSDRIINTELARIRPDVGSNVQYDLSAPEMMANTTGALRRQEGRDVVDDSSSKRRKIVGFFSYYHNKYLGSGTATHIHYTCALTAVCSSQTHIHFLATHHLSAVHCSSMQCVIAERSAARSFINAVQLLRFCMLTHRQQQLKQHI